MHKELVGDRCYHVSNTDDGVPSIRSVCKGNADSINEGFAFLLDSKVNNCPSYLVPYLACRQFPAKEMVDQGVGTYTAYRVFTCSHSASPTT